MHPSIDGRTVAISSYEPDAGSYTYRILDVERRRLSVLPGRTYDDIVGMLGDELVVWEDTPMGALKLPLRAIARDGTSRRIADQDGWAAAIDPRSGWLGTCGLRGPRRVRPSHALGARAR